MPEVGRGYEIAIIGMSGRFPGARDVRELWEKISTGTNCISFFSKDELQKQGVDAVLLDSPDYVRAAPIIEDMETFDASFFRTTTREAELMDPQQRIFLECCWEALEGAGYAPASCKAPVGVFAGARTNTYLWNVLANRDLVDSVGVFQLGMGNDLAFLTSRVSHILNLRGPSCSVHTACSTSLVAVHLACQSLLRGECTMALAGGVAINIPHVSGYLYEDGSVQSPDGYCRAFDADARGTVFGSGAGVVVLKSVQQALADGDSIYAVVCGSAINNDGAEKASFAAPSARGQTRVIKDALTAAELPAERIRYVECHGTGTLLGDAIEVRALTRAFGKCKQNSCAIGSVKTNVGHLDAAAGITGLIKVVLSLQHRRLPPSLHFRTPNPQVDFAKTPFYVNTTLSEWPNASGSLNAAVSAFGIGGTNAHVVLEEAPPASETDTGREWQILTISARSQRALEASVQKLARYLEKHVELNLADIAYTLHVGRQSFSHRTAIVCRCIDDAIELLKTQQSETVPHRLWDQEAGEPPIKLLFCGELADQGRIVRELYGAEASFHTEVDRCAEILAPYLNLDLRTFSFRPTDSSKDPHQPSIEMISEVSRVMLAYCLGRMLCLWGVKPTMMLGDSFGEYAAALLAEVMSLEDGLPVVVERSRLLREMLSGNIAVERAELILRERLEAIPLRPPVMDFLSAVTGVPITPNEATSAAYWTKQLAASRQFDTAFRALTAEPGTVIVRVGEKVSPSIDGGRNIITIIDLLEGTASAPRAIAENLARLWETNVGIDWENYHAAERRQRIFLPTYPFERKRHWISPILDRGRAQASTRSSKLADVGEWFWVPSWKFSPAICGGYSQLGRNLSPWVIFGDDTDIGQALADKLDEANQLVIRVRLGSAFQRINDHTYYINGANKADYASLFAELVIRNDMKAHIVHLWSLASLPRAVDSLAAFGQYDEVGFYSLFRTAHAIINAGETHIGRFSLVTRNSMLVESPDQLLPEQAGLSAFCRVLQQEHPWLACNLVDIEQPEDEHKKHQVIGNLIDELILQKNDSVVAYRGKRRWIQSFEKVALPLGVGVRSVLKGGVYMITGGLGAVGLLIANFLARTPDVHLVLVGRTGLPPREEWQSCLADLSHSELTKQISAVQELESLGVEVEVLQADVCDITKMRQTVNWIYERFGRLDGVIHAAGVTSGPTVFCPLTACTEETFAVQAKPKVQGTYVLGKVLEDKGVSFVLCVSSNASILGGLGFAAYSAANACMDAYATNAAAKGTSTAWISSNWDHWPSETKRLTQFRTSLDDFAMTRDEAFDAFSRIVSGFDAGQIIVSTGELSSRARIWVTGLNERTSSASAGQTQVLKCARPHLQTPYVEASNANEREIAGIWEELLGIDRIGIRDDFFALGGHSLIAIKLMSAIRSRTGVDLPISKLFEGPTVAELALALSGREESRHAPAGHAE